MAHSNKEKQRAGGLLICRLWKRNQLHSAFSSVDYIAYKQEINISVARIQVNEANQKVWGCSKGARAVQLDVNKSLFSVSSHEVDKPVWEVLRYPHAPPFYLRLYRRFQRQLWLNNLNRPEGSHTFWSLHQQHKHYRAVWVVSWLCPESMTVVRPHINVLEGQNPPGKRKVKQAHTTIKMAAWQWRTSSNRFKLMISSAITLYDSLINAFPFALHALQKCHTRAEK